MFKNQIPEKNKDSYEFKLPTKSELMDILDGRDAQKLVKIAEDIAEKKLTAGPKHKRLSTSQIRNVYGTVKKLELEGETEDTFFRLVLLKPKLAYAAGRHKEIPGMEVLKKILCDSIDLVSEKKERFANFCKFFEAILAYHKAYGGK